jgi:hypothetical protein
VAVHLVEKLARRGPRTLMTIAATIHCKVCRTVYALFSDTLLSRGDHEKNCDICGHMIARWTSVRIPVIRFVKLGLPTSSGS